MAMSQTSQVIQHLRRMALQDGEGLTDQELLGSFIERRDDAAFAALVKRHGPLVWGVCRRLLGQHDAEDAFQATFFVLCRKAASIRRKEMVASWLYGVAYQTALQARRAAVRRRARERQVVDMPEPPVVERDLWSDVQPLLDKELSCLPDNYRVVLLLCDMEDKSRKEVARQLGLPEGTVASRLARARSMLAKRLARHGLAVSAATLAALLSQKAAFASAPASVVSLTIKGASLCAAGQAAATGALSVKVAALTDGVLKTMLLNKLMKATVLLLVLATTATGIWSGGWSAEETQAGKPTKARKGPTTPQRDTSKTANESEIEKLLGAWTVQSMTFEGKTVYENIKGSTSRKVVITRDTMTFSSEEKWLFKIDPTKTPKEMDLSLPREIMGKKVVLPGIYSLEGHTLKVCFDLTGQTRPTAFASEKGRKLWLWVFRRTQPVNENKSEIEPSGKSLNPGKVGSSPPQPLSKPEADKDKQTNLQPAGEGIPRKDYAQHYSQSFKGDDTTPNGWRIFAHRWEDRARIEPAGLRITLPPGVAEARAAGITSGFGLKGDFEVSLRFEILKDANPRNIGKAGTHLSLTLIFDTPLLGTPEEETATFNRTMRTKGFYTWLRSRHTPAPLGNHFPMPTTAGRLCLVRSGDELFYLASSGADQPLELLQKYRFGPEDVQRIMISGMTSGEKAEFDLRVTDFVIAADAIPRAPGSTDAADASLEEGERGWLLAGVVVFLLIGAILTLGYFLRRRGAAASQIPNDSVRRSVAIACPKCAASLKTAPEMAGKKVKCPQCGTVLLATLCLEIAGNGVERRQDARRLESQG